MTDSDSQNIDEQNMGDMGQAAPAPMAHAHPEHSSPAHHSPGHSSAPREMRAPRQLREENTIFIGRKSTMGYVLAVVTQFQNGAPEVKIKARGKIISQAVDVAEIVRNRFLPNVKVGPITIQTEDVENEDHSRSKVSSIQIVLLK